MSELSKVSKRMIFKEGKQKAFIEKSLIVIPLNELARLCSCSERTIRDWRREKFTMPYSAVDKICERTIQDFPKQVRIIDAFAHTSEAGKKGGRALIQKYGKVLVDGRFREEQWKKWWEEKGKVTTRLPNIPKEIERAQKSKELAEFVGIMMGDGGISDYQCSITLHSVDDAEYSEIVVVKVKKLFGVSPTVTVRPHKAVRVIVVSRVRLVEYLHDLGLPVGNKIKQGLDIPTWIKKNKAFSRSCVRGLFDTDGSVFTHKYQSKGRHYSYKKMSFTSASPALLKSVAYILAENGMSPRISGHDVRLDSVRDVQRYFKVIGSSNPKHLNRLTS